MRRALWLILLFSILLSAFSFGGTASAETDSPYALAFSYAEKHPRRDVLSGSEKAAGATLSAHLTEKGYAVSTPSFRETVENDLGQKVTYEYSHVIGFKDNGKGKTLLVGGYYGGYEPTDSLGVGEGAVTALTVGAILYVADALANLSLEYDLAIAFWGGMELSLDLDLDKIGVDLSTVALYVNFDGVAAGKSDYLYADDLPRTQEKYFLEIASEQGANLLSAPLYKKPAAFSLGTGAYSYVHLGLLGANRCFLNAKVPCVSLIGGAWEYESGLYRYPDKGELEGTALDTFAEIDGLNGGKEATESRLLAAANVVIKGLSDPRLSGVLDKAAKELTAADLDSDLVYYLVTFIGIGLLLAFFIVLIVKQGKDRRERVWTPSFGGESGGNDPYEELRGEDAKEPEEVPPPPEKESEDEDIFRF